MVYSGWKLGEPNVYCVYLISNPLHECVCGGGGGVNALLILNVITNLL